MLGDLSPEQICSEGPHNGPNRGFPLIHFPIGKGRIPGRPDLGGFHPSAWNYAPHKRVESSQIWTAGDPSFSFGKLNRWESTARPIVGPSVQICSGANMAPFCSSTRIPARPAIKQKTQMKNTNHPAWTPGPPPRDSGTSAKWSHICPLNRFV